MERGRPTSHSPELAATICARIAEGESVRSIAKDPDMPTASTIHLWVFENRAGFSAQYEQAKQIGAELESEELEEIARTEEDVARARLITDVKKWAMSKKLPRRFGDKLDVTSGGKELPAPLLTNVFSDNSTKEDSEPT